MAVRAELVEAHLFRKERRFALRQAQGERWAQFRALITRPTEHSGVTFGAATSVLLTGVGVTFGVGNYKRGDMKREDVRSAGLLTYETVSLISFIVRIISLA